MKSIIIARDQQAELAARISSELNLPLVEPQTVRFADSEMRIMLEDKAGLAGAHAIIVHATSRPVHDNLLWLLFACHALQQAQVSRITAVVPYFGYGRQNKNPDGTLGAAKLVAQLFKAAGISQVISVAMHVPEIATYFAMPVYNITLEQRIANFLSTQFGRGEVTLVAPDHGAFERVQLVAALMKAPTMVFEKERFAVNKTRIVASRGVCKTKHAVIIDDIIDTGSTIIDVGQVLYEKLVTVHPHGAVHALAIHPVLSANAVDCLQESVFQSVWVTNTIQLPTEKQFDKLGLIDISEQIAQQLREVL